MTSQLIILAAICLTCVAYALPVPDEEVSVAQAAPASKNQLDIAKKPEEKPIEPINSAKTVETRAVEESKPIAKPASHPSYTTKSEIIPDVKKTGPKTEIELTAPDAETAAAIPEKKTIVEKENTTPAVTAINTEKRDAASVAVPELKKDQRTLDKKKNEKKAAARTETEEPIEGPKAIPLVAPAANTEVQRQVVDESKIEVHSESPVGKSPDLLKESAAATITNIVEEKKSVEEKDAKVTTENAPAKKLASYEEIKGKEKATSISPLVESVTLIDLAAADISPVIVPSAQEEKKLIAEEKQPARQERINEHEFNASTNAGYASNAFTDATTTNEAKSEETVQLIPSSKNTNEGQVKPAEANEQTSAELKQGAASGRKQINSNAEENKSENKNVAAIVETTSAPESKKIVDDAASLKTDQENKVAKHTKKTIIEKEKQQLKKTDDKKISSEEKFNTEKKSEESNDSSESKESDESDNSKEEKSN